MSHDSKQGETAPPRAVRDGAQRPEGRSAAQDAVVVDLTIAQMEAAARLRASRRRSVPCRSVVAVGGRTLRARSVEQPFPAEERAGFDGFARVVLLVALLAGVGGGYLYATLFVPERPAIEVSPPETRRTVISEAPAAFHART